MLNLVLDFEYLGSAEKVLVPNNYASNVIFIFEMFPNLNKNTDFAVDAVSQGFDPYKIYIPVSPDRMGKSPPKAAGRRSTLWIWGRFGFSNSESAG